MKICKGAKVQLHVFLTSALVGGEWSVSRPSHVTAEEGVTGTHWIGGWVGHRSGIDTGKKKPLCTCSELKLIPRSRQ
jgi:hypothetical protein